MGSYLIDGAHNPPAARALAEALREILPEGTKLDLVFGACADKDVDAVLHLIKPFVGRAFAVKTNNPRSLTAEALGQKMRVLGFEACVCSSLDEALKTCAGDENEATTLPPKALVCGSLFLVGETLVKLGVPPNSSKRFDPSEALAESLDDNRSACAPRALPVLQLPSQTTPSSQTTFGIDIGTTSVSGVAVDEKGNVIQTVTLPHEADLPKTAPGIDEQDPEKLYATAVRVIDSLTEKVGPPKRIGWTGQMHGVVAVDRDLNPLTPFVTWRDARRYGGIVMAEWHKRGLSPYKCLTAPGYVIAKREGKFVIDPTFLESWHLPTPPTHPLIPLSWLPDLDERSMLGDNQAGVYAAQTLLPGCAVINIGTSGQLSVVREGVCPQAGNSTGDCPQSGGNVEIRRFVDGKSLLCRASLIGGQSLAALRRRLGIGWEELNERAGTDPDIRRCIDEIVDDLAGDIDLTGVTGLVGVGNALVRNPALRQAVERRFGLPCVIPKITEMAAYGAALFCRN